MAILGDLPGRETPGILDGRRRLPTCQRKDLPDGLPDEQQ